MIVSANNHTHRCCMGWKEFSRLHPVPEAKTIKAMWLKYTSAVPQIAKAMMVDAVAKKAVKFDFSYKLPLKLVKSLTVGDPAQVDSQKALALAMNEIGQWMYIG